MDIGNAGSGTRATDLTTLVWYTFQDPLLDGVRRRLWTRILDLVGWEGAAVLAAAQILHMLEIPIRHGRHDVVPGVVKRGHRALDELNALRGQATSLAGWTHLSFRTVRGRSPYPRASFGEKGRFGVGDGRAAAHGADDVIACADPPVARRHFRRGPLQEQARG